MAMAEKVVSVEWLQRVANLRNFVDDDDSSSSSDDGNRPPPTSVTVTESLAVAETSSVAPPSQRRSSRVLLPSAKKKAAAESVTHTTKKKSTTKSKKNMVAKVVSDAESNSSSSSGSEDDEGEEETRGRAKKKKPSQKSTRTSNSTSSSKMSRPASSSSQRDRSVKATKKEPTATKEAASADAKAHMEKVQSAKARRKAAPTKKEHAVAKKTKPVATSDSSGSSSDTGSDSDDSSKRRRSEKYNEAERAASTIAMARKREVAAKERADRLAPKRIPPVVSSEAPVNESAEQSAQRIIRLQRIPSDDSIKPEYEAARSRSSSASRKRPLPSPKVRADDHGAVEKKSSSADREHAPTTLKEREEPKASTKENGEPVSSSKAGTATKREAYKKKQLLQEEQDWKLALALGSRKSDRPRRRTGSEDTLDSVKRERPADDRPNKRKRAGSSAASPTAVELPKADDQKPPKRVRKTSVDAGSKRVETPKASDRLKSPKKARKVPEEKAVGVVSRAKSHPEEKPTPPRKKTRASRQDNGVSIQESGELKTKRDATPKSEKERDETVLSKKRRDRKPVAALAFEGITEVVKPTRLLLGSKSRPDSDAVVGKKLMVGPSTPSRKEKERDELQIKKRREQRNSSGAEFDGLPRMETESDDHRDAAEPISKKSANGLNSVTEPTMARDAVKSEPVSETHLESDPAGSEAISKRPVSAEEAPSAEETKRESDQAAEVKESSVDSSHQKPNAAESINARAEPVKKISVDSDGDKEEGEEDDEEGAVVDEVAVPSTNGDLSEQDANVAAREEKSDDGGVVKSAADPVDLMSFVIPKKKFRRTDDSSSARTPGSSSLPPVINASIRRTPASSPLPRELEAGKGNLGSSRAEREERVIPRRRRRIKNPVAVAIPVLSRQEKEFMHLARKVNSLVEAARKTHAIAEGSKASSRVGPYDVVDSNGNVIPDFIPRMKCPTKKQMKTQTDQFPTSFFGVSMSLPGKTESAEDFSAEEPEGSSNQSEALQSEINIYEQLVFERREDREAYLKKMYGTAFVPQLLRGLTSLIMRNVRYERKSTGFQFNTERDREEFAKSLSERYTMNKSAPRCEIPPKNWQQLMNKMPAIVYLHYMNKEDGELAAQRFFDDNGVPLERKRTNRVGGTISAGNLPAPQTTPRRSRSNERSAPESSPVVARKESLPRDSSQGARSWQPFHDEQRSGDRREDRNGSSSGRGPREWPPRFSDSRGDRRPERVEEPRGDRRSEQRYGPGDGARDGSQRSCRRRGGRNRSRTRSRSRSRGDASQPPQSQSQSVRECDENYWPSDNDKDAGRQGHDGEQSDFHDSQAANSAEELSDSQGKSMPRSSSQGERSRPYFEVENGEEKRRLEDRRDDTDGHRDRIRSESLGKENREYASDSKRQHVSQDDVEMEEGSIPREQEQLEGEGERSRTPEQDRTDGAREENADDRASGRGFDGDRRHHRGEELERSRSRDDPYYHRHHNGYDNDNQDADRVLGEYEFAGRDRHSRRHSRSRSRSHPRQPPPHLNHPDRLDRGREHALHHDREYSHARDGGRFSGEFDDRNDGYNYEHGHHERDRAFNRHGGSEFARHQRRHHPY